MESDEKMSKLRTYKLVKNKYGIEKLRTYKLVKNKFGIEKYLELNERNLRKSLTALELVHIN